MVRKNNTQRYKSSSCNKTFNFKKKLNPIEIGLDYTSRKQTHQQLAEKYHCSVRTIQRYIEKLPKTTLKEPKNQKLNILIDTTFFRRDFAVLVLMNSNTPEVVSHYFVKTEKDIYYKLALNRLREKGYIIQSITCDGRLGLLKDLFDTPTQMCQFHRITIVMRKLKRKHRSLAEKELVKR